MSFRFTRVALAAAAIVSLSPSSGAVDDAQAPTIMAFGAAALSPQEAERLGLEARQTNSEAAAKHLEAAALAGRPFAQAALAQMYWDGAGVPKNAERALRWYRAAAEQGVAGAQSFLGWALLPNSESGLTADPQQAFRWFSAAARQEDPYALRMLADFFGQGLVVERDLERAQRLIVRAALLGDLEACRFATGLYLYGPQDHRDARLGIHFLTKAAHRNDPHAAYLLAREYLRGAHVRRDAAAAAQWLTRAFEREHALAALWLSAVHFKGVGVPRDLARAEEVLARALSVASLRDKNLFAWELAVGADANLRDGALAIRVLEPALAAAQEKSAAHLDTLAAAYAEVRQFDKAVETQAAALAALRRQQPTPETVKGMEERLELFRRGEPYREESR